MFASAGNWVQQVTLGWLAYYLTGSAFIVGSLSGVRSLPFLIAGPIGGVLSDRMDRRKLLIVSQSISAGVALIFAGVVKWGDLQVWHLFVFSLVSGAGWALNNPLRQALVANSVPRESLMNAIALNSTAFNLNRAIGPALGGVLIALTGPATNFFLQAVLFLGFVLMIIPIRVPQADVTASRSESMMANFRGGIRYVRQMPTIMALIMIAVVPSLFIFPFTQGIMPVFAEEVLHAGPSGLGILLSSNGFGAFLGTLMLASVGNVTHMGMLLLGAAAGTGVGIVFFSFTTWMPLSMLALMLAGGFQQVYMSTNNTLIQSMTSDEYRGRVMSLYMLDIGFAPLGGLLAGTLAQTMGAPRAVLVGGVTALVLVVLMGALSRRIREARPGQ